MSFLVRLSFQFTLETLYYRYRGTYRSQDVAIKILKAERLNEELQKEFAQEVYIMRFAYLSSFSLTKYIKI